MKWSGIVKFLLGSALGIAILVSGGLAVGYYFMTRLTQPPPKPMFANDPEFANRTAAKAGADPGAALTSTPAEAASPLEPGTYRAQVTYPEGLLVRDRPSLDATRIGGVAYNQQLIVLEETADRNWQRIRPEAGGIEGWVKAGNVQRVN